MVLRFHYLTSEMIKKLVGTKAAILWKGGQGIQPHAPEYKKYYASDTEDCKVDPKRSEKVVAFTMEQKTGTTVLSRLFSAVHSWVKTGKQLAGSILFYFFIAA